MCTQSILSYVNQLLYTSPAFYIVTNKYHKSSIEKVIINSGTTDHFFTNQAYFFTYKKYHHKFQTDSGEILTAYGYGDVVVDLGYADSSEVTLTVKIVSWALSLGHNLLSTILFTRKGVEVFLWQPHILLIISYQKIHFGVANIIVNQYVVSIMGYFSNSTFDQGIINVVITISI